MARRSVEPAKVALFVLFCLSLSLVVLVTDPFFTYAGLEEEAIGPTKRYIAFVFGFAPLPEMFVGAEASHMRDVAWILRASFVLLLLSAGLIALFVRSEEWRSSSAAAFIIFCAMALVVLVVPFDGLFHAFHLVFFPQGNWTFPVDSVLIGFYPQSFFAWYAAWWLGLAAFTALAMGAFGSLLSR